MKTNCNYLLLPSLCMAIVPLAGCSNNTSSPSASSVFSSDSIPQSVKELVKAVDKDDSVKFASLVSYPLSRPYPLHDIENEKQMKSYYSVMVDDSLKSVIRTSKADNWSDAAWRGWTLHDGQYVWLDENLYDVPYLSAKEKNQRAQLIREELASLHPELGTDWNPEFCLKSPVNGTIYRVDAKNVDGVDKYRMAIYDKGVSLRDKPSQIIFGVKDEEGSADTPSYIFAGANGEQLVFSPDDPGVDDGSGMQINITTPDSHRHISVEKTYWLDNLKP